MPAGIYPRKPIKERFEAKVDRTGDCHIWTAGKAGKGYGSFNGGYAHRFSYEMSVGPIPEGMVIDHLCRVPACVNPDHLEVVTYSENIRRGISGQVTRIRCAEITHCPQGHEYTEENTRVHRGKRNCKTCSKEAVRKYEAKNRVSRMLSARAFREKSGATIDHKRRAIMDDRIRALDMRQPDMFEDEGIAA